MLQVTLPNESGLEFSFGGLRVDIPNFAEGVGTDGGQEVGNVRAEGSCGAGFLVGLNREDGRSEVPGVEAVHEP